MTTRWVFPFGGEQMGALIRLTAQVERQKRLVRDSDASNPTVHLEYELARFANSLSQRACAIGPTTPRGEACCRLAVELVERAAGLEAR